MARPYSPDLRLRVLRAYQNKEGYMRQIAQRFQVSLTFVRNLLRHYRTTGSVNPKQHGGGKVGERVVSNAPRNKGKNTSVLGALSLDGLIASMTPLKNLANPGHF